jgi:hypothetical protein
MNHERIQRTVSTRNSMQQIETSLRSTLNNVRVDEISAAPLSGTCGNKLVYRLFGAYVWPGTKNFPMRFTVSRTAGDAAQKTVTVDPDTGEYLVSMPRSQELFNETADALIAAVAR